MATAAADPTMIAKPAKDSPRAVYVVMPHEKQKRPKPQTKMSGITNVLLHIMEGKVKVPDFFGSEEESSPVEILSTSIAPKSAQQPAASSSVTDLSKAAEKKASQEISKTSLEKKISTSLPLKADTPVSRIPSTPELSKTQSFSKEAFDASRNTCLPKEPTSPSERKHAIVPKEVIVTKNPTVLTEAVAPTENKTESAPREPAFPTASKALEVVLDTDEDVARCPEFQEMGLLSHVTSILSLDMLGEDLPNPYPQPQKKLGVKRQVYLKHLEHQIREKQLKEVGEKSGVRSTSSSVIQEGMITSRLERSDIDSGNMDAVYAAAQAVVKAAGGSSRAPPVSTDGGRADASLRKNECPENSSVDLADNPAKRVTPGTSRSSSRAGSLRASARIKLKPPKGSPRLHSETFAARIPSIQSLDERSNIISEPPIPAQADSPTLSYANAVDGASSAKNSPPQKPAAPWQNISPRTSPANAGTEPIGGRWNSEQFAAHKVASEASRKVARSESRGFATLSQRPSGLDLSSPAKADREPGTSRQVRDPFRQLSSVHTQRKDAAISTEDTEEPGVPSSKYTELRGMLREYQTEKLELRLQLAQQEELIRRLRMEMEAKESIETRRRAARRDGPETDDKSNSSDEEYDQGPAASQSGNRPDVMHADPSWFAKALLLRMCSCSSQGPPRTLVSKRPVPPQPAQEAAY